MTYHFQEGNLRGDSPTKWQFTHLLVPYLYSGAAESKHWNISLNFKPLEKPTWNSSFDHPYTFVFLSEGKVINILVLIH